MATDSSQGPPSSIAGPPTGSGDTGSRSGTGSRGTGSGSGTGSDYSGSGLTQHLGHSICAFWLGKRCYAIDTGLVGEVVLVENVAPVPMANPAILGLFNLRGSPVALVDLSSVLEISEGHARYTENRVALVLRGKGGVQAAVLIDRMEMVIPAGEGTFTPRTPDEHLSVQGFLTVDLRGGMVITLVDSTALLERLERLKYRA